jgi:succinoglycan biosynthesis protein ExoM
MKTIPHICVCICTYKRPDYLSRLLKELATQNTQGLFRYSVVVVDNDQMKSAEPVVTAFTATTSIRATYCVEPRQNIALARNEAIRKSDGDYVAFIDDDEYPTESWLLSLYNALIEYQVDGALGPVKPHFDVTPPQWVVKGKFYERATYRTGFVIDWRKGRTGNLLLKRSILTDQQLFRPEFRTGEDQDFFRRMIDKGHVFIWCNEAVAYEVVPPIRWKRTFMLRRALLRGTVSLLHPSIGAPDIAKSAIAVPLYAASLPIAFILGQPRFMQCLISMCDHLGRILAFAGINAIREPYVTE